jgi:hypothetical protein
MTSKRVTAEAVAALYTAAGRRYAETELSLYHNTFAGVDDDDVREAVGQIVKAIDLANHAPTPALVLETVRSIKRRREMENQPLAIEAPAPTPDQYDRIRGHIAAARELIANAKTPQRRA